MYSAETDSQIAALLSYLYGAESGERTHAQLQRLIEGYRPRIVAPAFAHDEANAPFPLDHSDSIVIAYGNQFYGPDKSPLKYLQDFLEAEVRGTASGVHVLPFFPYSSDDGFSVIDYYRVDPQIGDWTTIREISSSFRLMADLVLNHCSVQSSWFQRFLAGERPYDRYFITVDPETDLSQVVRPRARPLLTPFDTAHGRKYVWTTFSEDQVDLNYNEPAVLLEMLEILLFYLEQGVQIVRLDAVAYLWKEIGTSCIHHPKTHAVVQLMRAVLEEVAPWALIITETNVPHAENVRYFGHGDDEAHMVYNFPLPPLVLHSFLERDTTRLQEWARRLEQPGAHAAFFNFLASHDGVGLMPVRGLLTQSETDELIAAAQARGARISYKATSEGQIPYEINVNYLSGLTDPGRSTTERARQFLASQAVMLAFAGVPGIYLHSLIGSENYEEGVRRTGESRAINREQLNHETLRQELRSQDSLRAAVFQGFTRLLRARRREPAFHPTSPQEVLASDTRIVAIRRGRRPQSTDALAMNSDSPPLLCVHNVSAETVSARFLGAQLGIAGERASKTRELLNVAEDTRISVHWEDETNFRIDVPPFGVLWLKAPSGSS